MKKVSAVTQLGQGLSDSNMERLLDNAYHVPDALSLATKGLGGLKGPLKPCRPACGR